MALLHIPIARLLGFFAIAAIAQTAGLELTNNTSTTLDMCKTIESHLQGRISYAGNSVYSHSLSSYYTEQERDLGPRCVFTPTSTDDVSEFVKLVTADRNSKPQFAIRSGGHKYFAGAANIGGGITVDLRSMHDVTLSEDVSVVSIGGGAIWSEDVYPALVGYNLSVAGARLPGIGVGGFVTGGGLTFGSRMNGWACDSVVGFEIVLASGKVVNANATSYSDLWLALKGGSNNFGIVTHFNMATYSQGNMLGGAVSFNYSQSVLSAQADAFSNFMEPNNFDEAAMMGVLITYEGGSSAVTNSLFYLKPDTKPSVYDRFLSMPGQVSNTLEVADVQTIVGDFGAFVPKSLSRAAEITYSFNNGQAAVYTELFKTYNDSLSDLLAANITGSGVQWLTQPQPVTDGFNTLGLTASVTDRVISNIVVGWDDAADDDFMMAFLESLMQKHVKALKKQRVYIPFVYLNYAGQTQDPIGSYGKGVKEKLQAVSKKYDPGGIFQTQVPGGFKLFT